MLDTSHCLRSEAKLTMSKLQSSLLIFSALLCLTWGWEPGTQYVYKYVGRSLTGIQKLKQQNAVIELQSLVTVQSVDAYTLVVKLSEGKIKKNGNYQGSVSFTSEDGYIQEIDGYEETIADADILSAPFSISHNKGSINGVKIGADEPLWIVNYKKAIASQLQLDITGIRRDGPSYGKSNEYDNEGNTFNVFEDSVTGDCSTNIAISPLTLAQLYKSDAFKLESFAICNGNPVYQVVKTRDFNRCQANPAWHSTTSNVYTCDFDKANCGDFLKRNSITKFVVCGESLSKLTVVQANTFSDLVAQPFAVKTEELVNSAVTNLALEKVEKISYPYSVSSAKEHKSLSYVFDDFEQSNDNGAPVQPNLSDAYLKNRVPVGTMHKNILDALVSIDSDMKEKSDYEKDKLDRLAVIARLLPTFSLDELKYLWQDVKSQDCDIVTLFVDCLVQAGSNPSVMLVKELIETEQITGHKANFAMSALGYYVKTPTRELLRELVDLLKSDAVKSSKTLLQIGLMTVSDLLNTACGSRLSASKRFPISVMGDFCDSKDSLIVKDFLPLVSYELEYSQEVYDRIIALTALGALGVEEVVPVLLPVIRGTPGKFDDTAERVRAILSLHRVVFTAPEKVHPILASLATNVGERHEVRMAAIGLLLTSNAPQSLYLKLAGSTWFESSRQVASFIHTLISSLARAPGATPFLEELSQKARVALPSSKPCQFGLPYSFYDIQSSHLDEGISVLMHTIWIRDSDTSFPAYFSNSYYYQLGPLNREPFTVSMWNFNMVDSWQELFSKFYGRISPKYNAMWAERRGGEKAAALTKIWDELNAVPKPAGKSAGILHINLLGSVNRFFNLEKLGDNIKELMTEAAKDQAATRKISMTKYRMLAEYNVRFASELGLPIRFLFTLPMLASLQGTTQTDGKHRIDSNLRAELIWKLGAEIRVDIPFSGNHISTGVDVIVYSHAPKETVFHYNKGRLTYTWIPDSKVIDLFAFEVAPYTACRLLTESIDPTIEKQKSHLISVTDKPKKRNWPLGDIINLGINVQLIEHSELENTDNFAWSEWINKWDINSWSNLGFVPLDVRSRKYLIRYDPAGTKSKSVATAFFYQYATKTNKNTLVFETGANKVRKAADAEIVSYSPIGAEFRPLLVRLFKNIDSGNARLMTASLTSTYEDGTVANLNSTVGMAMNDRYTQDCTDWQVELSVTKPYKEKKVDFAICYKADRTWDSPPTYGFSKNVLKLTEVDTIGFGPECEHKVKFTAKLTRDEEAAKAAINSAVGQQCLKDMEYGFKHGSPACTEARNLDHTYNNYELVSEVENMSDRWFQWARSHTTWVNQLLEKFIVKQTHGESNTPNRASWTIKRDPESGKSDMVFVRPHETVEAKEVRWTDTIARFSPLTQAYAEAYYPLTASSNYILKSLNITSAGVSESKCYVGTGAVHTFDGAFYQYAVDECQHVLLTDCHKKSELAILAKKGSYNQKIVTVIYGKDTVEIDPSNYIIVNGAKTDLKDIEKGKHIEIRGEGSRSIKALVYPLADGGVIMDFRTIQFFLKVQDSHVELSAPVHLRGRTCGLCGDFNQDLDGEFKTAYRCAVTSGELMAASFKLASGGSCYADKSDLARRLQYETETCMSIDQQFHTYLPNYDVNARYKCKPVNAYTNKASYSSASGSCSAP